MECGVVDHHHVFVRVGLNKVFGVDQVTVLTGIDLRRGRKLRIGTYDIISGVVFPHLRPVAEHLENLLQGRLVTSLRRTHIDTAELYILLHGVIGVGTDNEFFGDNPPVGGIVVYKGYGSIDVATGIYGKPSCRYINTRHGEVSRIARGHLTDDERR